MILTIDVADILTLDETGLTVAKATLLTEDVLARAMALVPELAGDLLENEMKAAKAILRRVVLRSAQMGSGAVIQRSESNGAYSASETIDSKQTDYGLFMKHEIQELKNLFPSVNPRKGKAFSVEMW